jgi:hypothetical protein
MEDKISHLITEIRDILLLCGVKPTSIAIRMDKLKGAKEEDKIEILGWLVGFRDVYVEPVRQLKGKIPEHRWAYFLSCLTLPMKKTWEEDQFLNHRRELRERWKQRPSLLTRAAMQPRIREEGTSKRSKF